ncbi:tetratricopeptide repeat protein [Aquabacterium sp. OR-4]|uniref:tetratricopeptide repeat protein n=1 Tax=Aquabacterium sp. OR-4 TaxID=2978127 RepID=UPI0021B303B4|nr:tetratricopeptide repeat protein [Aquabacterium sp. OR-4]MDT7837298.1 tetratricopeptide repeat protein [Aquabacterium sp. OR-4]
MAAPAAVENSALDAPLFYQLLIGEMELRAGRAGSAYEIVLDAARRQSDEALFQRAVEIALQARAGDQALAAARAWASSRPLSVAPMRYQTQILFALNRPAETAEPLAAWLQKLPVMERPGLIGALPRLVQRMPDRAQALALVERLVAPYQAAAATRQASQLTLGRMHLANNDAPRALALAQAAQAADPASPGPVLLALEMLPGTPAAEALVTAYLAQPQADAGVRLAWVRSLTQSQRYADAASQLDQITRERPQLADPWLTLGALRLEMRQPAEAEAALQRYVTLAQAPKADTAAAGDAAAPAAKPASPHDDDEEADGEGDASGSAGLNQAWLLLAQAAEQRGDVKAAEQWLAKVDNPQRLIEVQTRRATMLARQGKLAEARALIRSVPERTGDDARAKAMAEAQMLRDVKRWREAAEVLADAAERFKDDTDLIYEQAMVEEKLGRFADMERLLRRVIELKPEHSHAHNALGYSMVDRNVRLPEARALIQRALELSPGDPFITDSLGWAEFRMGRADEALRLLRQAYSARPDTEIAAHLGEVLWAAGQQDEARRVWREAQARDAQNEVLRETLARLKVGL